jgi:antitoxin HicB
MDYPVVLERDDNETILVSFPDFPEVHTFGDDEPAALRQAVDALATGIDAYIKDRREIPLPSAKVTKHRITLPALSEAKVRLYEAMRSSRVNKAELARRLKWHMPQVDRLLEMTHESRLGQLEAAFGALGKRLVVAVDDGPAEPEPERRGGLDATLHGHDRTARLSENALNVDADEWYLYRVSILST